MGNSTWGNFQLFKKLTANIWLFLKKKISEDVDA